jgi:uncharacterized protein (TIGR03382 family)
MQMSASPVTVAMALLALGTAVLVARQVVRAIRAR